MMQKHQSLLVSTCGAFLFNLLNQLAVLNRILLVYITMVVTFILIIVLPKTVINKPTPEKPTIELNLEESCPFERGECPNPDCYNYTEPKAEPIFWTL